MKISDYKLSGKTYIVTEIGQAHDGSIGILHSMIRAAADAGVDAVKFQVHIAEAESSSLEPFRKRFSTVDASRYDYWKRMELSYESWCAVKKICEECSVEFLATPYSNAAVDLLEKLQVERFKVGSGDLTNPLILKRIASTGKEVILSTGLGSLSDLDSALDIFKKNGNEYTILQCTTQYPTSAEQIGLGWINYFQERYDCPVGLSDHSGKIYPSIGAVALGATVLETHLTFDKRMFGPDSEASLTVDETRELVLGTRFIEKARGMTSFNKGDEKFKELRQMFGRSLAVNKDILSGSVIGLDDLEGKKPSTAGIPVSLLDQYLGKKLTVNKKKWEFLYPDDFID